MLYGGKIAENPERPFPFIASWESAQLNTQYLSLGIKIYYFSGGAHGSEEIHTFNYDMLQKKKIRIQDFFDSSEEAQEHADTVIVGEAEETWPQFLDDFRNGTRKKIYVAKKRPLLINLPVHRFSLMDRSRYLWFRRKGLFRLLFTPMLSIQTVSERAIQSSYSL